MVLLIAPVDLYGRDDQNKVLHDVFSHVIPALALSDADSVMNSSIASNRSRW